MTSCYDKSGIFYSGDHADNNVMWWSIAGKGVKIATTGHLIPFNSFITILCGFENLDGECTRDL